MTECLDEETILAFCDGSLAARKRAIAEEHIASCDECRQLVSAVARASMPALNTAEGEVTQDEAVASAKLALAETTPSPELGARPAIGSAPVQPGDILADKYEVERVLGIGGMGVVVAARHLKLDQKVALKFLLPAACEVPGAVARFLREGKASARITSEHVARVVDTGMLEGGAPYLVMEHLEGNDLAEITKRDGPLAPDKAIEYVLQACEAIVEAHDLGIIHRDLKPANLFLTKRKDGSPLVKVLDFGISKIEGGSRSQLTSASMLMGSPRYMSPEQMLSAKDVDARTDVWALGVILFELLSGKPVWEADTVQGLCALIASAPAPSLRERAPNVPAALDDVVARCLAKKREDRIASIGDLALALAPIAPPSAKTSIERILRIAKRESTHVIGPGEPPPRPKRLAYALGALVTALLLVGIVWNMLLGARASADAKATSAPPLMPMPPASIAVSAAPSAAPLPVAAASEAPLVSAPPPPVAPPLVKRPPVRPATTPTESAASAPAPSASQPNRALTERK